MSTDDPASRTSRRAGGPGPPRWQGVVLGVLAVAAVLGVMWWGIAAPSGQGSASGSAAVATCVTEQQRCRMGGAKLGLCARLPDGELRCLSQH